MNVPARQLDIEFTSERERQDFAEAVLGEDFRNFVMSPVGRLLHGRAKAVYEEAKDKIYALDPYTSEGKRELAKLKAEAWAADHFMLWCVEAIQRGDEAATQLRFNEDQSGE